MKHSWDLVSHCSSAGRGCSSTHLPHPSSSESLSGTHQKAAVIPMSTGIPQHWGTPGDPSQPLDAVPEGFPQAISTIPSCPCRPVPVVHAIPCGTGLLSFGQLVPMCDLALEAAGNGPGLPGCPDCCGCLKAWREQELAAL